MWSNHVHIYNMRVNYNVRLCGGGKETIHEHNCKMMQRKKNNIIIVEPVKLSAE